MDQKMECNKSGAIDESDVSDIMNRTLWIRSLHVFGWFSHSNAE